MKFAKITLLLYLLLAIISFMAKVFGYNELLVFSRVPIALIMYAYYYAQSKKLNYTFTIVMLLSFLTDCFVFFNQNVIFSILSNFVIYVLFFLLEVKDRPKFIKSNINITSLVVLIFSVFFLYLNILFLFIEEHKDLSKPFMFYGLVISFCTVLATYNLIFRNNKYDFYYFLSISTFLITDTFYVINKYYFQFSIFIFGNFLIQIASYFFMVKFMLEKEKYQKENEIIL